MPGDGNRRETKNRTRIPAAPDAGAALYAGRRFDPETEIARLKQQIRANERIWERFRQIEIRMIGAGSFRELAEILVNDFPRMFPSVDCVTLACFDPEYELTRLLEANDRRVEPPARESADIDDAFINITHESLAQLFPTPARPRLGACSADLQRLLFPACPDVLNSVALAPLVLRDQLVGSFNQGSRDPAHFAPGIATDLLEHLAAVAAMCLDNAVNRERLRSYGLMDPLTGIANRRLFERRLSEEIERWFRREEPLSYMLIDIDHFKQVNDRHGHQVGDQVLQQVAELLGRDLRGADVLARFGGEEFVVLLPDTGLEQGVAIAQRWCDRVAQQGFRASGGERLQVTVSIGVASLSRDSDLDGQAPSAWLFNQADAALYRAKQGGRNRVVAAAAAA